MILRTIIRNPYYLSILKQRFLFRVSFFRYRYAVANTLFYLVPSTFGQEFSLSKE
jgi:hypothetical protein